MLYAMLETIEMLQTLDYGTLLGSLAIIIVAIPKIKKYLDEYESASGFQFPWTTRKKALEKRFNEMDEKISNVDNRITTTRKEVEDKFSAIHNAEHIEHEAWHQQSITIRDNLAANQHKLEENQDAFMKTLSEITSALSELKADFLDERLERKRWNIINCARNLRNGEFVDLEEYRNVFQDYDTYEEIIQKHNLKNGLVEESIKFIREKYKEFLCK